jgi:uncharacterized protein YutE (UPF0331/DUF86 family)/predicted nucleotidyltransferase
MDAAELTAHVEAAIAPLDGVAAVYLFGSVAAGTDTPASDIDLGVLYEAPPAAKLDAGPLDLEGDLERRLRRPAQVVVLNDAPADLRIRVVGAQRLLVERNRSARIRFEVATRNEFFDLEPMLLEYRRPRGAPGMIDATLVAKSLAAIETALADLRRLAQPDLLRSDLLQRRFVEHTLQIAIQAALDVASHIVSDDRLGEPRTNREVFALLAQGGWVDAVLHDSLSRMAGFRNVLVHGYDDVNLDVVRDVLDHRVGDLEAFAAAVRRRL